MKLYYDTKHPDYVDKHVKYFINRSYYVRKRS